MSQLTNQLLWHGPRALSGGLEYVGMSCVILMFLACFRNDDENEYVDDDHEEKDDHDDDGRYQDPWWEGEREGTGTAPPRKKETLKEDSVGGRGGRVSCAKARR